MKHGRTAFIGVLLAGSLGYWTALAQESADEPLSESVAVRKLSAVDYCVRQHPRGLVIAEAMRVVDAASVPQLWTLLGDREQREHWHTAVKVVALHGGAGTPTRLIDFIEHHATGYVDYWQYIAFSEGLTALGLWAARNPRLKEAENVGRYLIGSTDPRVWHRRKLAWQYGSLAPHKLHVRLARRAVNALAITGQERAAKHFDVLERDTRLGPVHAALLKQARNKVVEMRARGFAKYYSADK